MEMSGRGRSEAKSGQRKHQAEGDNNIPWLRFQCHHRKFRLYLEGEEVIGGIY